MPAPLRYVQDSADFPDAVDVVIIGAGIAGAAAAWELTKKRAEGGAAGEGTGRR
ncbi:hypothetical protein OJE16_14805 [Pantoea tagorei]